MFQRLAERIEGAEDREVAGAQRLMEEILGAEDQDASRIRSTMHVAGEKLAALGRELLIDLGHQDLVGDDNAMMFVAMTALSSVQTGTPRTKA